MASAPSHVPEPVSHGNPLPTALRCRAAADLWGLCTTPFAVCRSGSRAAAAPRAAAAADDVTGCCMGLHGHRKNRGNFKRLAPRRTFGVVQLYICGKRDGRGLPGLGKTHWPQGNTWLRAGPADQHVCAL